MFKHERNEDGTISFTPDELASQELEGMRLWEELGTHAQQQIINCCRRHIESDKILTDSEGIRPIIHAARSLPTEKLMAINCSHKVLMTFLSVIENYYTIEDLREEVLGSQQTLNQLATPLLINTYIRIMSACSLKTNIPSSANLLKSLFVIEFESRGINPDIDIQFP